LTDATGVLAGSTRSPSCSSLPHPEPYQCSVRVDLLPKTSPPGISLTFVLVRVHFTFRVKMPSFGDLYVHWTAVVAVLLLLYVTSGVVYRLYFSPLAKFPGPRLAAATLWYEAYYDVIKQGQYTFKIKELHQKYGKYEIDLRG
jgi:hypothetical protein